MFHAAHEITVSWFALWTDWFLWHLLLYFFVVSPKILYSLWKQKVLGFLTHFSPWLLLHRNHPNDWSWKLLSWFYHNATPNKNSLTVIAWISFNIIAPIKILFSCLWLLPFIGILSVFLIVTHFNKSLVKKSISCFWYPGFLESTSAPKNITVRFKRCVTSSKTTSANAGK